MEHMSVPRRRTLGIGRRGRNHIAHKKSQRGFTLLELIFVILIGLLMTVMAVPLLNNVTGTYRLRSASSSVSGVIQSTRYLAISSGYTYQVVFKKTAATFQIQSDPNRTGTFANYCVPAASACAIPLANSGVPVALGADTTLQFRPSGLVSASAGSTTLTLTYGGKTQTITVSSYGSTKVTP
jgi:prepilin-type N-terminal cleavage/methylation domain-containing protein